MNIRKWWPYGLLGVLAVIVAVSYPRFFDWWDHDNCRESGGTWNEAAGRCIEPRNADIPDTSGSKTFEDDNQGGDKPRE